MTGCDNKMLTWTAAFAFTSLPACKLGLACAGLQRALVRVPSAVFEPSLPGHPRYTLGNRIACVGVKFLEYSLAGIACGLIGQGIANGLMHWKYAPSSCVLATSAWSLPALTYAGSHWQQLIHCCVSLGLTTTCNA